MNYSERAEAILNSSYSDDYDKNPLKINALTFSAEYIVKGNELDFHVCFNNNAKVFRIINDSDINKEFIELIRKDSRVKLIYEEKEIEDIGDDSVIVIDIDGYDSRSFSKNYISKNNIQLIIIIEDHVIPEKRCIVFEEYGYNYVSLVSLLGCD